MEHAKVLKFAGHARSLCSNDGIDHLQLCECASWKVLLASLQFLAKRSKRSNRALCQAEFEAGPPGAEHGRAAHEEMSRCLSIP